MDLVQQPSAVWSCAGQLGTILNKTSRLLLASHAMLGVLLMLLIQATIVLYLPNMTLSTVSAYREVLRHFVQEQLTTMQSVTVFVYVLCVALVCC